MKNGKCLYNKSNQLSKSLNLKSILFIFTIGLFIFFGFASIEEYPALDCEFYNPPIARTQNITIEIYDKETGKPIAYVTQKLDIIEKEKRVNSNFDCELKETKSYSKTLDFGSTGKATFTLNKTYLSKDDEIIIFIQFTNNNYEDILRFEKIRDYHSNLTLRYGYLNINKYS